MVTFFTAATLSGDKWRHMAQNDCLLGPSTPGGRVGSGLGSLVKWTAIVKLL